MRKYAIAAVFLSLNAMACVMTWENSLTGRITDSTSKPLEGVTVKLVDPNSRGSEPYTKTATTDATGVYFIEIECSGAFPNGGYCPRYFNLTATKAGFTDFIATIRDTQETKVYDIKMQ